MYLHLRTSHPGRLLHLERRICFFGRLARDVIVAMSVVLSLIFADSAQVALLQLGLVVTLLGVAHVLASGSVRITPNELVTQSGWPRARLPREREEQLVGGAAYSAAAAQSQSGASVRPGLPEEELLHVQRDLRVHQPCAVKAPA